MAGAALLLIATAPVLARSATGLGMHDAVAAELAANSGQAEDTLEQLSRGGILAGLSTPTPAEPVTSGGSDSESSTSARPRTGSETGGGQAAAEPTNSAADSPSAPAPTSTPTSSDSATDSPTTGSGTTGSTTPEIQSQQPDTTEPGPTPVEPEPMTKPVEPDSSDAPPSDEAPTTAPQTTDTPAFTGESPETPGNVVDTLVATLTDALGG